jgi:hypothetical protein
MHIGDREVFTPDDDRDIFPIEFKRIGERKFQSLNRVEFALLIPGTFIGIRRPACEYQ